MQTLPVYFISHGGGPWPWIADMQMPYQQLAQALAAIPSQLPQPPSAILMISAHWEAAEFTVQSVAKPNMIYDYFGFPDYTYQIQYHCSGSLALTHRVQQLLTAADIPLLTDKQRGYDHGMYSPLQIIYPQANIPVVQLSLKQGLDPQQHIALGMALSPLRSENILIIGSGLSYHNLRAFGPQAAEPSRAFDDWLYQVIVQRPPSERSNNLINWQQAPSARFCHPREEHLLPLMVAAGAGIKDTAQRVYHETNFMGGLAVANFRFG